MSNAVLLIACHPATRPTAMRNSWPLISVGVNPSTAMRATRSDELRVRTFNPRSCEPRNPASRSARSMSATRTSLVHGGSSWHASSWRAGSYE